MELEHRIIKAVLPFFAFLAFGVAGVTKEAANRMKNQILRILKKELLNGT